MARHLLNMYKKAQAAGPMSQGRQGVPGGAGPGVAGTPKPGALPSVPRGGQQPPGGVHQDQMADGQVAGRDLHGSRAAIPERFVDDLELVCPGRHHQPLGVAAAQQAPILEQLNGLRRRHADPAARRGRTARCGREVGDEPVPFEKFASLVKTQVQKLGKRGTDVSFQVAVKDGKVSFTARALKGSTD